MLSGTNQSATFGPDQVRAERYGKFWVIRDDMLAAGGTKSVYLQPHFASLRAEGVEEVVTHGYPWDKDCLTVALSARLAGLRCTLVYPANQDEHARQRAARRAGAKLQLILPPHLTALRVHALEHADKTPHTVCVDLQSSECSAAIARHASAVDMEFLGVTEIWVCISGGATARGISQAFPDIPVVGVITGRIPAQDDLPGVKLLRSELRSNQREPAVTPFNSCAYYDAKAYQKARLRRGSNPLFWNTMGDCK